MPFIRNSGLENLSYAPKAASVVINKGDALKFTATRQLTPMAANDTGILVGFSKRKVAATDADYAANTEIAYDVPVEADQVVADVTGGTLDSTKNGPYKMGSASALSYDVAAAGTGVAWLKKKLSASKGIFEITTQIS